MWFLTQGQNLLSRRKILCQLASCLLSFYYGLCIVLSTDQHNES